MDSFTKETFSNNTNNGRARTKSSADSMLFGDQEVTIEDLTVLKLMEEIMEIDQEIKLKQKWINSRMQMLHKLLPKQSNQKTAIVVEEFLHKIQPEYPKKISVTYEQPAIPLRQADVFPDPIQLKQADVFDSAI